VKYLLLLCLAVMAPLICTGAQESQYARIDFRRDVEPILSARCYSCHGPESQISGLRLDVREGALKGGDSGVAAIVPGRGADSPLIKYVSGSDPKTLMPPRGERLTASQIETLRRWIDEGVEWPEDAIAIDFARDIQPILSSRCYRCHGPGVQTHNLRLDRKVDALKGGDSGVPAIVPGRASESLLIRYVAGLDPKVRMPAGGPPLDANEVRLLRLWIDQGARWPGETRASQPPEDPKFERGRKHWAFQSLLSPAVPAVKDERWVRNPIDAFVLAKLESRGWKPVPPAGPRELMRRVYLDLTGLPPSLAEQDEFLKNGDAERLVESLLSKPAYGERWARHWLDLVRYAETNGYERDAIKPNAWRYRDYVIRAFNADKPYDRFILEQLAGDELPDRSTETLIATTYYRLGPWDDEPADPKEDRFDQLEDIVSTTSQAFLGLTLGCARCHNHKFEPLTSRDYYSMLAVFNGLQRPTQGRTELDKPLGTPGEVAAQEHRDLQIEPLEKALAAVREGYRKEYLESGRTGFTPETVKAFLNSPGVRSDAEKKLVKANAAALDRKLAASQPADVEETIASLEARIHELREAVPDLPRGYLFEEPSPEPPPTFLLIRGKAAMPGPEVPPAVPTILVKSQPAFPRGDRTSLRRVTLARWISSPKNPLMARVIVNRIWQYHFGEGLVRTPSDFGLMGEKPTHPELLDWLANWFVQNGLSIKKLHRLIMSSSTYRMSKRSNPEYAAQDPENRMLWHMAYRRLEAEAILDSMLAVSGRLNPKMYGPSIYPYVPEAALTGSSDPDEIWKPFDEVEASRRAIYSFIKRSLVVPALDVLDLCDTVRSSAKRMNTNVAPQALTLFNGFFVNLQARHFAERLIAEAGNESKQQIELAYRLALARSPGSAERVDMLQFLQRERARISRETGANERVAYPLALQQLCRVIFNLNEFVYTD
jgi:hypothetical protein